MSDLSSLKEDCELASLILRRQAGALQLILLRDKGTGDLVRFKHAMLGSHQQQHYLEGVKKLGIQDTAPAVVAAKYHYLSNLIGGSSVQYIEETPKKVWIRYFNEDLWSDGSANVAMPAVAQRATFSAWHANNASLMANSRLAYVCTKVRQDGEPYNEGYFIEHDHDIAPGQALRFEAVERSPAFDPARAPRLDPNLWPQERILRARRKYAAEYLLTHVRTLWNHYGLNETVHLIKQAMAILAVQNHRQFRERFEISATGFAGALAILKRLLAVTGEEFEVTLQDPNRATIALKSGRFFFGNALPDQLREALFAFPSMFVRLEGGTTLISRRLTTEGEVWEMQDTGRWQY